MRDVPAPRRDTRAGGNTAPAEPVGAVALLIEDPDLAAGIREEERATAERLVVVPAFTAEKGAWNWNSSDVAEEPNLGLLILEGFVTVNVHLDDRVASQVAGAGDVLYGGGPVAGEVTLPARVSHAVGKQARIAVLDRRFIAAVRRWPELLVALHERLRAQERRLAIHAAIGKLRRVEDRVLAVLWHLGERWGRVTPEGVIVPLVLTHEALGRLAGAERPTVSLALTGLGERGDVRRRDDGAFVLRQKSWERLESSAPGAAREPALAVSPTADAPPRPTPEDDEQPVRPDIDLVALQARIAALHEELPSRVRDQDAILAASRQVAERSRATRRRVAAERQERPTG